MARSFETIARNFQTSAAATTKDEVLSLPPGYISGLAVRLYKDYTAKVSAGYANVGGRQVNMKEVHQLASEDWTVPRNLNRHYYLYFTKEGYIKVDIIEPEYNSQLVYYEHPTLQWRCIGKLWTQSSNIVFVTNEVAGI
jgi:hypothetical protein